MVHVKTVSLRGDDNIGLYAVVSDTYAIVGHQVDDELVLDIKEVLKVPIYQLSICGTSLIGVFLLGDEKTLFVPDLCFDHEREAFDKFSLETGVDVVYVKTMMTALGNNMIYQNNVLIANEEVEQETLGFMKKEAEIKHIERVHIADTTVTGSSLCLTSQGGIVHPLVDEELYMHLQDLFDVKILQGTVAQGSPYVAKSILANKNGFLIGESSTGPEITNVDDALGFLEN